MITSRSKRISCFHLKKSELILLLVTHLAVVLPHAGHLPLWSLFLVIGCVYWRFQVGIGSWKLPTKALRFGFVLVGVSAVLIEHKTIFGAYAGVTLLVLAFSYKLLETYRERDVYIVVLLAYLVTATALLFTQSFLQVIYLLFCVVLSGATLVSLNHVTGITALTSVKKSASLTLQSLPLMIVLFMLVPRVGPIWTFQSDTNHARIGLSDSMSPGDVAHLTKSDALAFRAKFDGATPPANQRYWRALVLDHYDGKRWHKAEIAGMAGDDFYNRKWLKTYNSLYMQKFSQDMKPGSEESGLYRYNIIMEPSDQTWLFSLDRPLSKTPGVGIRETRNLYADQPVTEPFSYKAASIQPELWRQAESFTVDAFSSRDLQLPKNSNPRARHWAQTLREESETKIEFVEKILRYLRQQPFYYTLDPPLLTDDDRVDEFIFQSRKGFCAHYAGAFAFLMRSVGIPARVIAGYQGGEENDIGSYLLVYQFHAHAWVEIWLPERGWVRIDPTAAVSPERVELGIEGAFGRNMRFSGDHFLSSWRYRQFAWLSTLRHGADYLRVLWIQNVLGYNSKLQSQVLSKLFGSGDFKTLIVALSGISMLTFIVVAAFIFLRIRGRALKDEQLIYYRFCKKLERSGIKRGEGEGEADFACRVARELPHLASAAQTITSLYATLRYSPKFVEYSARRGALKQLHKMERQFSVSDK